jgi:hypothetical protein
MHFLREMRGGDEEYLPKLRWGTGESATPAVSVANFIIKAFIVTMPM